MFSVHNKTTVILGNRKVGYGCNPFIIAEGGNNHQGDVKLAHEMTELAAKGEADCIKWQVRDIEAAMSKKMREEPYNSPQSFSGYGGKYGDHRAAVELDRKDWPGLKSRAEELGLEFTVSAWDLNSLAFVRDELKLRFVKIASGDAKNYPLLDMVAASKMVPMISTGMCDEQDVVNSVRRLQKSGSLDGIVLFHCSSSYPCPDKSLNVSTIRRYNQLFPECVIGYSGHESDLDPTLAAVAQGAMVLERHFTKDKKLKGNDQSCSLTWEELLELRKRSDRIVSFNGNGEKVMQPGEADQYRKLGKTLHTTRPLFKGQTIGPDDVVPKSPGTGITPCHIDRVIGSILLTDLEEDQPLTESDIFSTTLPSSKYHTEPYSNGVNGMKNKASNIVGSACEISVRV